MIFSGRWEVGCRRGNNLLYFIEYIMKWGGKFLQDLLYMPMKLYKISKYFSIQQTCNKKTVHLCFHKKWKLMSNFTF